MDANTAHGCDNVSGQNDLHLSAFSRDGHWNNGRKCYGRTYQDFNTPHRWEGTVCRTDQKNRCNKLWCNGGGVCYGVGCICLVWNGRTGEHFWGFEMHGVKPDIVTMARAIGNGFPMAAVVTTPEIAKTMGQVLDLNTFGGNALGSAVGLAVLKVIEDEQAQKNCLEVGTHLIKQLALLRDEFECIGDVRGKGLMVGIEMVADKDKKTPISAKQFMDIWEDCKDMGVLLGRGGLCGNVLRMQPPMCITKADADFTVDVIRRVLLKQRLKNKKTQDRHK